MIKINVEWRLLMAYRIVISLVEMKHILEVLDRRKIIESSDLIEQEDYLFIRKGDEVKLIVALNKMTSLYISNRSKTCLLYTSPSPRD